MSGSNKSHSFDDCVDLVTGEKRNHCDIIESKFSFFKPDDEYFSNANMFLHK